MQPSCLADRAVGAFHRIGDHDVGPIGAQRAKAFGGDIAGHAQLEAIAARRGDHRVGNPGVARRRVEDDATGSSRPDRSASLTIAIAARSFTEPPGFWNSAFA